MSSACDGWYIRHGGPCQWEQCWGHGQTGGTRSWGFMFKSACTTCLACGVGSDSVRALAWLCAQKWIASGGCDGFWGSFAAFLARLLSPSSISLPCSSCCSSSACEETLPCTALSGPAKVASDGSRFRSGSCMPGAVNVCLADTIAGTAVGFVVLHVIGQHCCSAAAAQQQLRQLLGRVASFRFKACCTEPQWFLIRLYQRPCSAALPLAFQLMACLKHIRSHMRVQQYHSAWQST
jgi:hypothetical protein